MHNPSAKEESEGLTLLRLLFRDVGFLLPITGAAIVPNSVEIIFHWCCYFEHDGCVILEWTRSSEG